ncbi:MAG: hypothetical protein LLG20_23865 [Acidobacteriales bacterium]|nr:hypothetical protein [Terriglobales bacterium]
MEMLSPSAAAFVILALATAWSVSMLCQGSQIDDAANPTAVGLFIASLIIASSYVLTAGSGPKISGLPLYGLFGCIGATIAGIWMIVSVWRGTRRK